MDHSPPDSSVHGILQEEYWSRLPCPPPGDLPDPGIKLVSLMSHALAARFLTASTTWEAPPTPEASIKAGHQHFMPNATVGNLENQPVPLPWVSV